MFQMWRMAVAMIKNCSVSLQTEYEEKFCGGDTGESQTE